MSIPVIFTHTNNSLYLQLALLQAKKTCGGQNVCLIGDASNRADYVRHFYLSDYDKSELCAAFERAYKHRSPNPYNYELFCLKRWFVALEFLSKNNFSECFCVDSDAMVYEDLEKARPFLAGKGFSVIRFTGEFAGPQCCYFTREALERYCRFILKMYGEDFFKLEEIYEGFQKKGYVSGLSDMVLLAEFCKQNQGKFVDFDYSPERDFCFDENFGISYGFECGAKGKAVNMKDGVPFVKRLDTGAQIKFFMLHFQGNWKPYMKKYSALSLREKLESPYYLKLLIKASAKDAVKKILPKKILYIAKKAVKK